MECASAETMRTRKGQEMQDPRLLHHRTQVEFLDIVVRPLVCVIVQILPELGEMSPALFRNFCLWLSVIRQDTE